MPAFRRPTAPSSIDTKPKSPTNVPASDKPHQNATEGEHTSSTLSPPQSPLLYIREDRDALAIEHDRQKYFKALDRARNKAKKAFGIERKASLASTGEGKDVKDGKSKTRVNGGGVHHHHGAQEMSVAVGDEEPEFWMAVDDGAYTVPPTPSNTVNYHHVSPLDPAKATATEVRLADLVFAPQVRKTSSGNRNKKQTGLGGDYEFIPHIRSVIVLDDAAGRKARDMEVDFEEAWECIEDEETGKKDTYASIAAAALSSK